MKRSTFVLVVLVFSVISHSALAQQRSAKRGIGWDEKTQAISETTISKMAPGISWIYNWGTTPKTPSLFSTESEVVFLPMCWNANYDEAVLRNYLSGHPEVKVLLGFNEPNFSAQSNMTPQQAVNAWPKLEQMAADYGLELAAPALNFTGEYVGGRTWSPYEWYDEFFRLYPTAKVDYLVLHCYMNWYSSTLWFATEYFYKDLYNPEKTDVYGRYPNIVNYLNTYKEQHGHFPLMYLTEFCAWEGNKDGFTLNAESQIDQMTQKLQLLEQSDLVAGYAWFMGNANASAYPYMSLFQTNTPTSDLSMLGKVYVHMSSFDTSKFYTIGEQIAAKDYVDASLDNQQPKLRPNSEAASSIPLQVEWGTSAWMGYQVDIPVDGTYDMQLHMKSSAASSYRLYRNALGSANRLQNTTALPSTDGQWSDVTTTVTLPAGQYTLILYNMSSANVLLSSLHLQTATGIADVRGKMSEVRGEYYNLNGQRVAQPARGLYICNGKKIVIRQ